MIDEALCEHEEFHFHRPGPSCACRSLYDLVYRARAGIVASKSFVFSTSDANEFAETDTKQSSPSSIDLSMSSATQRHATSSSNKSNGGISAICFLSTPTIREDSRARWCKSNSTTRSPYDRRKAPFTSHDFSH
ncbi:hypothetical protein PUN28_004137 [Cardiocondyla obscurior]|uniref:Uncharacterized protein n=1 Tax=Cardiocondyla obscurior TaxID=286306 RepID=A0AAW2GPR6_9HYME